jgi:tetratricopeptide (TPR) repeat protein
MTDDARAKKLLQDGIAAAKAGKNNEARMFLEQAVELDERSEQGWLWLSGVVDSLEERRICLEHVLAINPNNEHAQAGLRWLEQQAPPPDESPTAEISVDEEPTPPSAERCPHCGAPVPPSGNECPTCHRPLILPCPGCGQYVEVDHDSCPHCGYQLGDIDEGASYYLALAQDYYERRKIEPMRQVLDHARREANKDPDVFETLAGLYQKSGNPDLAIEAYEEATTYDPDNAMLLARLSLLYRERSQPDKAQRAYQQAVRHAGKDPDALCELARIQLLGDGDTDQALQLLETAIRKNPKDPQVSLLVGDAFRMRNDPGRAISHYRRAAQLAPPQSEIAMEAKKNIDQLQNALAQQVEKTADRAGLQPLTERRRPGCLTTYAVLTALSGVFGILAALVGAVGFFVARESIREGLSTLSSFGTPIDMSLINGMVWVYVVVVGLSGLLAVGIAISLWNLRNWARIVVIILQGLGTLGVMALAIWGMLGAREAAITMGAQSTPIVLLGSLLVAFVIQAYITYWFVANGELFE